MIKNFIMATDNKIKNTFKFVLRGILYYLLIPITLYFKVVLEANILFETYLMIGSIILFVALVTNAIRFFLNRNIVKVIKRLSFDLYCSLGIFSLYGMAVVEYQATQKVDGIWVRLLTALLIYCCSFYIYILL